MAERVRYVDTASTAGGDGTADTTSGANRAYPSLLAAEAGEQDNFDSDGDWLHVLCRSSVGGPDTSAMSVSGSITSAADFMLFEGNGEFYEFDVVDNVNISIPDEYVRFASMRFSVSGTNAVSRSIVNPTPSSGGADIRFDRCYFREEPGGGSADIIGIGNTDTDTIMRIANCVFDGFRQGNGRGIRMQGGTLYLSQNVFHDCDVGVNDAGGTVVARNNIAQDCGDGFLGTFDGATDYNISDIAADAPGANSIQGTVTFADGDFHLDPGDTVAVGAGTDLSADANHPISEDIDGLAYASWDGVNIGVDQFASGGGGPTNHTVTLNATLTAAPSLATRKTARRTLGASLAGAPSLAAAARRRRTLAASLAAVASLSRGTTARRTLSANLAAAPSLASPARRPRTLGATMTGSPTITYGRQFFRELAATMAGGATLATRGAYRRALSVALAAAVSLSQASTLARTLSATLAAAVTLSRPLQAHRTLDATMEGVPTLATPRKYFQTLSATAAAVATLATNKIAAALVGVRRMFHMGR